MRVWGRSDVRGEDESVARWGWCEDERRCVLRGEDEVPREVTDMSDGVAGCGDHTNLNAPQLDHVVLFYLVVHVQREWDTSSSSLGLILNPLVTAWTCAQNIHGPLS